MCRYFISFLRIEDMKDKILPIVSIMAADDLVTQGASSLMLNTLAWLSQSILVSALKGYQQPWYWLNSPRGVKFPWIIYWLV